MKRIFVLLLALTLVFTCVSGAFAEDTLRALLPNCPLDRNTLYSARVIEEKTGYKIAYDQLPADNWLDTLNMIIANGEDYDYVMANTEAQNLIMNLAQQGALVDLTPYLADHPNLASVITDYSRSTFSIDGTLYAIGMEALSFDGYGEVRELMFYRQDWLDIEQCLNDYGIPLYLSHTITQIHGRERVTGVTVARVDERLRPIKGTEKEFVCDTVILSVGLLPENELSLDASVPLVERRRGAIVDEFYQTQIPGIFAAGNVLHVHDLVDFVSLEAERLAHGAAAYLQSGLPACPIHVSAGQGLNHVLPQWISGQTDVTLSMRVNQKFERCTLVVRQGETTILQKKIKKAIPAEMIQLTLKQTMLNDSNEVEVSVE